MTTKHKVIAGLIAAVLVIALAFLAGYFTKAYRDSAEIAGYSKREQERLDQIKANDAEMNQLRGANEGLRAHVAELQSLDEAKQAAIDKRGGAIAAEVQNLETNLVNLKKTNQAILNDPGNNCVVCRAYSDELLRARRIAKPLACKDECAGAN